ncbi:MAG: DNA (cytosine-5-)-methyltransferase [Cyanobacteria bacterium P01_D01_bin.156]
MKKRTKPSCLELFAGAGGLATGIELAGIDHQGFVEWDKNACQTLAQNYQSTLVHHNDIREFDFSSFNDVDIISGGPPCQPFSLGGKHKGSMDQRDMFPYACKAIAICNPKAFIFENVKGLLRKSFSSYFEYVILRLTYPEVSPKKSESWEEHLTRLEEIHTSGQYTGTKYNVVFRLVDAADYGVPQRRERVFIVGIREDLDIKWSFPKKTHSIDALLHSQYIDYSYWDKHNTEPLGIEKLDKRVQQRINSLKNKPTLFPPQFQPWKTVRDQIGMLPEPDTSGSFDTEHIYRDGARSYPGHTGSYIDLPSKAIKAGDHGVPGGENMIRYHDGSIRYFTTYEAKRIQTFPSNYRIQGSWTEAMRQIGNAVPVELGHCVAQSLAKVL